MAVAKKASERQKPRAVKFVPDFDLKILQSVIARSAGPDFLRPRCLVEYFYRQAKLETVISPAREHCSILLRKAAREKINFLGDLSKKLEFRPNEKEKAPPGDETQGSAFSS